MKATLRRAIAKCTQQASWAIHRATVDRLHLARSFSDTAKRRRLPLRLLLITEPNPIARSQIYPFYFYRNDLYERWQVELREICLNDYESRPDHAQRNADVVGLQTWFDIEPARIKRMLATIRQFNPGARIVFLDSFAPLDLRLAALVNDQIDLYVKKHVFRDRNNYFKPTMGDTNLTDYYGRLYGCGYSVVSHSIPDGFLKKMIVGPSFLTGEALLPRYALHPNDWALPKTVDVHGRLTSSGTVWYRHMREQAIAAMEGLEGFSSVTKPGVSGRQYLRELRASKICFSPFGYGEVCWRDYEAVLCGSLLVKPDMAHVETQPDIFVAHRTYVPIQWDFSDLHEVVRYYTRHEVERHAITRRAYQVLHDYASNACFLDQMRPMLER